MKRIRQWLWLLKFRFQTWVYLRNLKRYIDSLRVMPIDQFRMEITRWKWHVYRAEHYADNHRSDMLDALATFEKALEAEYAAIASLPQPMKGEG